MNLFSTFFVAIFSSARMKSHILANFFAFLSWFDAFVTQSKAGLTCSSLPSNSLLKIKHFSRRMKSEVLTNAKANWSASFISIRFWCRSINAAVSFSSGLFLTTLMKTNLNIRQNVLDESLQMAVFNLVRFTGHQASNNFRRCKLQMGDKDWIILRLNISIYSANHPYWKIFVIMRKLWQKWCGDFILPFVHL